MSQVICSRAHVCPNKPCRHKEPHEGSCGPAMPCHDDPSGEISHCIPFKDGVFRTVGRNYCKHCGGRGYEDVFVEHTLEEVDNG